LSQLSQSACAEQHALGDAAVDPEHVQTPALHLAETQLASAEHAAPLASPSRHVPPSHHPERQSPSPAHAFPDGAFPQMLSTQSPERHVRTLVHATPSSAPQRPSAAQTCDTHSTSRLQKSELA
jgi:hypothetical protein